MDVIFDIDGTLADASHRLHYITPPLDQFEREKFKKNWDAFLSAEEVVKDTPILQTWAIMESLLEQGYRMIFITGRPEHQREATWGWLTDEECWTRSNCASFLLTSADHRLYMRSNGDRRPSSVVKEEGLMRARADGYNPILVFEDRADDTAMWRRNGLLCCQVAEGNY
ncbi:MAG: hypothetical protein LPK02_07555 [Rhodobacterales bacterium]|nr:hypothetical protein [Rhodobacterales bacterium]